MYIEILMYMCVYDCMYTYQVLQHCGKGFLEGTVCSTID